MVVVLVAGAGVDVGLVFIPMLMLLLCC